MTSQARRLAVAIVAAITGLFLIRLRPVKAPEPDGAWHPADR